MKLNRSLSFSLVFILIFTSLIGCSNPKDCIIPADTEKLESDKVFSEAVNSLTKDEKELLYDYLMRTSLYELTNNNAKRNDITINDALIEQKKWDEAQAKEQERQQNLVKQYELNKNKIQSQINEILSVNLIDITFRPIDFDANQFVDYLEFKINFANKSDKIIDGAKGIIIFKDIFGDTIKEFIIPYDTSILPNSSNFYYGSIAYDFLDEDSKKLKNTPISKLKVEWEPEVLIFKNGDRIELPEFKG